MTTQGAGFHPSEGAWRPLGTRSYRRALCANRDGARVGPKGAVFSSSDGYSHTRGPEQQHLRALELKPRDRTIKKLHMEAKEGARAPMGGRNTGSGKKMPTQTCDSLEKENAPLIDESSMKPSALGGSGKNHSPPSIVLQGRGLVGPRGIRSAVKESEP